jgi:O-antigen/teichoic acid export membrane protein
MDRKIAWQSFFSLMANGFPALFGLLSFRLLAKGLSVEHFSTYILVMSVYGLFYQLRAGILNGAFIKLSSGKQLEPERLGSTWWLSMGISFVFVAGVLIVGLFDAEIQLIQMPIIGLALVTTPSFIATLIQKSLNRFQNQAVLRIIESGSFLFGLWWFQHSLSIGKAIQMMFYANALMSLMAIILGWAHIQTALKATKNGILELWHFGKFTSGTQFITALIINTDLFLLRFVVGPSAVGVFEVGRKWLELFEVPFRSISSVYFTAVSTMVNNHQSTEVWAFISKRVRQVTLLTTPFIVVLAAMAPWLIKLVAGEGYGESVWVFRVFLLLPLLIPMDRFYGLSLDALGMPKLNFYKGMILFVVNGILDWVALKLFPEALSVAVVSVCFYFVGGLLSFFWLKKASKSM